MKHLLCLTAAALTLSLALTACAKKEVEVLPADTVGLRITSEVQTGVSAERISLIPNDVAPWLSQILLLSDGQLYRSATDGGKAQAVNAGNIKDMMGLMRKGAAGTVLTLTTDGKLTAMIEKDDEGRLARLNVSSKAQSYNGFCQNGYAGSENVTAFSGKSLINLSISYEGNDLMTVTASERMSLPKAVTSCVVSGEKIYAIAGGLLYDGTAKGAVAAKNGSLSAIDGQTAPTVLYVEGSNTLSTLRSANPDTRRNVLIQDGLSTIGTDAIKSVYVAADSLGGTFSGGAVIAQDAKSDRLVLISLPFARKTLNQQVVKK